MDTECEFVSPNYKSVLQFPGVTGEPTLYQALIVRRVNCISNEDASSNMKIRDQTS